MKYKRLGDLLVDIGVITQEQLNITLASQKESKKRLGEALIAEGFLTEAQLIEALEMQLGIEFVDLGNYIIDSSMSHTVPKSIARKYGVVPVRKDRNNLYLAMSDPLNFKAIEEARAATRLRVTPMIATVEGIDRAIQTLYGSEGVSRAIEEMKRTARTPAAEELAPASTTVDDDTQSAPTVRLVNSIIERAVSERASDIHLEPHEDELLVRMRVDGLMRDILNVPKNLQSAVISRLKVMGSMDISEKRIPQDGRANITIKQKDIDLRMSTLPTLFGEKLLIRLLDKDAQFLDKDSIGLGGHDAQWYDDLLRAKSGVILIAGPTGAGKSSTMQTMIRQLNTRSVNLISLEDPVEYQIKGVNQVQINDKVGMTFASGLRAILRQDPDIIAVGEIRDGETADIAMRAAITGHTVLSTIHTSDTVAAVDRLLDIGVEPYLISGAVRGILSQRLVRRICPHCREEYTPDPEELEQIGLRNEAGHTFYHGKGCPMCFHTGYHGRTGVFEVLKITPALRRAILERSPREKLRQLALESGYVPLERNAVRMVLEGVTTVEETLRVMESVTL